MNRNTYAATIHVTANPDDVVDLTAADIHDAIGARLTEVYATPAGHEVRLTVDDVSVAFAEVDAEPDGYTVLLARLADVRAFHADGSDEPDDYDARAVAAIDEAIDLLRTHALPEDHPQAIR